MPEPTVGDDTPRPLWTPDPRRAEGTRIAAFARRIARRHHVELPDYTALWRWSVENVGAFWQEVHDEFDLGFGSAGPALERDAMPGARWFPGTSTNYVAHVFRDRPPNDVAVVEAVEGRASIALTWRELERQVATFADTLRWLGITRGDRVVGYLPNAAAAVVGFLATAAVGAVWSCCGPDYAARAAAGRLGQLEPSLLVAADGYCFGGRGHDRRAEVELLVELLPTVHTVVHVPHLGLDAPRTNRRVIAWEEATCGDARLEPEGVPFDHPLWVLYSSGTTGIPKGLVHGHGGVVLDAVKTNALHLDMKPDDRMLWHTTTNWMMWNFQVSSLLVGASVITYDGSPSRPEVDQLWRVAADNGATLLGTSPGYLLAAQRAGIRPAAGRDLGHLRLLGVTGSPLPAATARWAQDAVGPAVPVVSMSGGTDIVTALASWAPTVPTFAGELSCAALGVAIDSFDADGRPVRNEMGELVVTRPMPTMPLHLWNDPDRSRYRETYFADYPGVWRHGDWITITDDLRLTIHGRSDATLNRNGVRLGSADVYAVVEDVPGVHEALVLGVERPDGDYWMPLFVALEEGHTLTEELRAEIVERLWRDASPRHVPDDIIAVPAIPHTRTGKKIEVPLKRLFAGAPLERVLSTDAVDDPRALEAFREIAARVSPGAANRIGEQAS
jgi:acetoacetyl-CoA synthetase